MLCPGPQRPKEWSGRRWRRSRLCLIVHHRSALMGGRGRGRGGRHIHPPPPPRDCDHQRVRLCSAMVGVDGTEAPTEMTSGEPSIILRETGHTLRSQCPSPSDLRCQCWGRGARRRPRDPRSPQRGTPSSRSGGWDPVCRGQCGGPRYSAPTAATVEGAVQQATPAVRQGGPVPRVTGGDPYGPTAPP